MEIIEFTTVNPQWVATLGFVLLLIFTLSVVVSLFVNIVGKEPSIWILPGFLAFVFTITYFPVTGDADGVLPDEERSRVASEVSEVVGFEVSEGEIDLMLDEKPVRGVFYLRDGDTLVVEEK